MDIVRKALWLVEHRSEKPLTLDDLAVLVGVSPYHLTRAFSSTLGTPLMRYQRRRRLTEAARKLADGMLDILTLALDCGYSSHEAFSRAFKDEFGMTPESVRTRGTLDTLKLTEPVIMSTQESPISLDAPRIEVHRSMLLAGTVERYDCHATAGIPNQWQQMSRFLGRIPAQVGQTAYGACYNFDVDEHNKFDYMCAVEVSERGSLPAELSVLEVPEQKYAKFAYGGHISDIKHVIATIWSHALQAANCQPTSGPTLEVYPAEFNSRTGAGGFEIWVPVK